MKKMHKTRVPAALSPSLPPPPPLAQDVIDMLSTALEERSDETTGGARARAQGDPLLHLADTVTALEGNIRGDAFEEHKIESGRQDPLAHLEMTIARLESA